MSDDEKMFTRCSHCMMLRDLPDNPNPCCAATDEECKLLWIRDRMRRNAVPVSGVRGQWKHREGRVILEVAGEDMGDVLAPGDDPESSWNHDVLHHVAASSPDNVLLVLDRLRDAEDEVDRLRETKGLLVAERDEFRSRWEREMQEGGEAMRQRDELRKTLLAISAVANKWHNGDQTGGSSIDAMEAVSDALGKPF